METNYLLDTNVCISILKNKDNARQKVAEVGLEHCFISEITLAELYYGASKSGNKAARLKDVAFFEKNMKVVPIYDSLEIFGDTKAHLESQGKRVDDFDLLIGATAVRHNFVMVTDNTKHLGRIPNIQITNWKVKDSL